MAQPSWTKVRQLWWASCVPDTPIGLSNTFLGPYGKLLSHHCQSFSSPSIPHVWVANKYSVYNPPLSIFVLVNKSRIAYTESVQTEHIMVMIWRWITYYQSAVMITSLVSSRGNMGNPRNGKMIQRLKTTGGQSG